MLVGLFVGVCWCLIVVLFCLWVVVNFRGFSGFLRCSVCWLVVCFVVCGL